MNKLSGNYSLFIFHRRMCTMLLSIPGDCASVNFCVTGALPRITCRPYETSRHNIVFLIFLFPFDRTQPSWFFMRMLFPLPQSVRDAVYAVTAPVRPCRYFCSYILINCIHILCKAVLQSNIYVFTLLLDASLSSRFVLIAHAFESCFPSRLIIQTACFLTLFFRRKRSFLFQLKIKRERSENWEFTWNCASRTMYATKRVADEVLDNVLSKNTSYSRDKYIVSANLKHSTFNRELLAQATHFLFPALFANNSWKYGRTQRRISVFVSLEPRTLCFSFALLFIFFAVISSIKQFSNLILNIYDRKRNTGYEKRMKNYNKNPYNSPMALNVSVHSCTCVHTERVSLHLCACVFLYYWGNRVDIKCIGSVSISGPVAINTITWFWSINGITL